MNTNERRKAVKEIMDGAPPMVSRWKMSENLTRELQAQHGFTYPNRMMRKSDIDWWVKGLKVDDRQGVSITLYLKALAIADLATDHKRFGEAVKALEFVKSLLGLDLSAAESPAIMPKFGACCTRPFLVIGLERKINLAWRSPMAQTQQALPTTTETPAIPLPAPAPSPEETVSKADYDALSAQLAQANAQIETRNQELTAANQARDLAHGQMATAQGEAALKAAKLAHLVAQYAPGLDVNTETAWIQGLQVDAQGVVTGEADVPTQPGRRASSDPASRNAMVKHAPQTGAIASRDTARCSPKVKRHQVRNCKW